jgi:hypothetical protein
MAEMSAGDDKGTLVKDPRRENAKMGATVFRVCVPELRMKDETRGVITIVVVLAAYLGVIAIRRTSREPSGKVITEALGSQAGDILQAEAVVLVPESDDPIEVWPRGGTHSEAIPNREALVRWLCSDHAPRETAVVMLRGVPLGRGRLESVAGNDRMVIEELGVPPIPIQCPTRARFFTLELRLPEER